MVPVACAWAYAGRTSSRHDRMASVVTLRLMWFLLSPVPGGTPPAGEQDGGDVSWGTTDARTSACTAIRVGDPPPKKGWIPPAAWVRARGLSMPGRRGRPTPAVGH